MWVSRRVLEYKLEHMQSQYDYLLKEHQDLENLVYKLLMKLNYKIMHEPARTFLVKGE